jgi:hypothetical protein
MATVTTCEFTAPLWRWAAKDEARSGAWYFVSLPFDASDEIAEVAGPGKGFGSVRVEATIGGSTWRTSVFPSTEEKTYVLPVKKAVRTSEGLEEGGPATVRLSLV